MSNWCHLCCSIHCEWHSEEDNTWKQVCRDEPVASGSSCRCCLMPLRLDYRIQTRIRSNIIVRLVCLVHHYIPTQTFLLWWMHDSPVFGDYILYVTRQGSTGLTQQRKFALGKVLLCCYLCHKRMNMFTFPPPIAACDWNTRDNKPASHLCTEQTQRWMRRPYGSCERSKRRERTASMGSHHKEKLALPTFFSLSAQL